MKLLFSDENFSADFKELLGFVDADIRFKRLKSALQTSTMEIVDIIGSEQYEALVQPSPSDEYLLELVKYAIALKGYIIYAPTADLAVTNNGRLMRRDEHTVSAFQWQIEANDEGLERLYYRHLDLLLKYMGTNNIPINVQKYNHSQLIVPNIETFENYFNIENSHYLYLKLIPALREFEQNEALPRIGKDILSDKQKMIEVGIFNNLQNAAVCYAMAWGIRRLNIQLFPKGVLQTSHNNNQGTNKKTAQKLEYWETAKVFEDDYAKYLLKIEKQISGHNKRKENSDIELPELGFCSGDMFVDL